MSTTCQKDLSIKINPAISSPDIYYPLDAIGPSQQAYEVKHGGLDTDNNFGTVNLVAGKITNAMRFKAISGKQKASGGPITPFLYWGSDYTMSLWLRLAQATPIYDNVPVQGGMGILYVGGTNALIYSSVVRTPGFTMATNQPHVKCEQINDQNWHWLVARWDMPEHRLVLRMDNGADHVAFYPGTPLLPNLIQFYPSPNTSDEVDYCEFGLWTKRWDQSDYDYWWNSGAGRTWPH